jgi:16S rRNA (cytosine1402-N4)-methyltransferase
MLVLAYHSLEDRMVKQTFAEWSGTAPTPATGRRLPPPVAAPAPLVRLLTRKPMRPAPAELAVNPRSTSARLRAVERIG